MKAMKLFPGLFFFAILSFIIVYPLLPSGFILTLDMIPTPFVANPVLGAPSFLFQCIYKLLSWMLPAYFIPKVMLYGVFFLSGLGMYQLTKTNGVLTSLFGGILYSINPFTYSRVMAGHWYFLLGYALFPFFVKLTIDFFDNPASKKAFILAFFGSFIISIVIHYTLILALFFLIYAVCYFCFYRGKISPTIKYLKFIFLFLLLFNFHWIIPFFLGSSDIANNVSSFTQNDLIAFQSVADKDLGLIFNLLSGYGFWAEVHDYFLFSKNIIFAWPILSCLIIALSLYGLIGIFKDKEKSSCVLGITLSVIFIICLDLAGGVALKSFQNTVFWLYDAFAPLRGFREPQKLIGLLFFFYAYLGTLGLQRIISKYKRKISYPILALFLVLPFIYTPTIFGGFWGQLKSVQYPPSWYQVNEILNKDRDDFTVLFLPWHQYMRFNFANNLVIASPAVNFFGKPVLSSQNYETVPLYTHDRRLEALHVEGLLKIEKEGLNLFGEIVRQKPVWGRDLAIIDIKYIILAKDSDWMSYRFLDKQSYLEKVYIGPDLIVYRNLSWSADESKTEVPIQDETLLNDKDATDSSTSQVAPVEGGLEWEDRTLTPLEIEEMMRNEKISP